MDADGLEFFLFMGLYQYLKMKFNVHDTKCFIFFRLFTEAAWESQVASFTYIL
jgi:hypothetical protein